MELLRSLGLTGTKDACSRGECGACTVLIAGRPVLACLTLAARVRAPVQTIEGLATETAELRAAFADHGALQCGYCTPGMLMSATALLETTPSPTADEVKAALQGNICRCTGYWNIVEAVVAAGKGAA